jgi:hypothetical protein
LRSSASGVTRGSVGFNRLLDPALKFWGLEELLELLARQIAVTENFRHQPRADHLACVNWNDGHPTVRVTQKVMTPLHAGHLEADLLQRGDDFLAR